MNTETNKSLNEAENGNKSKPLLCIVAVLCLRGKDFKEFEKYNKKENEKFIWIYDYKQVIGMKFDRIEKVYDWYKMKNASEILEGVEIRLRSNYA